MYAYLIDVFPLLCKRTNDNLTSFPTSRDSLKILLSRPVIIEFGIIPSDETQFFPHTACLVPERDGMGREPSRLPRNSGLIIVYLVSC